MKFEHIIRRIKTPRSDQLAEQKEAEENNVHRRTNLSGLKDRPGIKPVQNIIDEENQYNSPEAEELVGGQEYSGDFEDRKRIGGKFADVEDLTDTSKEVIDSKGDVMTDIEAKTELATKKKLEELAENDPYDFIPILDKLFKTRAKEKESGKNTWRDEREFNYLFDRVNQFLVKYRAILAQKLPDEEGDRATHEAFRKIIGDVVYSEDQAKVLPRFAKIRDRKAPKTAEKVYTPAKVKNKKSNYHQRNKINPHGLKAYNTVKKKMESV